MLVPFLNIFFCRFNHLRPIARLLWPMFRVLRLSCDLLDELFIVGYLCWFHSNSAKLYVEIYHTSYKIKKVNI